MKFGGTGQCCSFCFFVLFCFLCWTKGMIFWVYFYNEIVIFIEIYTISFIFSWILELFGLWISFFFAWGRDRKMLIGIDNRYRHVRYDRSLSKLDSVKSKYYITFLDYIDWKKRSHTWINNDNSFIYQMRRGSGYQPPKTATTSEILAKKIKNKNNNKNKNKNKNKNNYQTLQNDISNSDNNNNNNSNNNNNNNNNKNISNKIESPLKKASIALQERKTKSLYNDKNEQDPLLNPNEKESIDSVVLSNMATKLLSNDNYSTNDDKDRNTKKQSQGNDNIHGQNSRNSMDLHPNDEQSEKKNKNSNSSNNSSNNNNNNINNNSSSNDEDDDNDNDNDDGYNSSNKTRNSHGSKLPVYKTSLSIELENTPTMLKQSTWEDEDDREDSSTMQTDFIDPDPPASSFDRIYSSANNVFLINQIMNTKKPAQDAD